MNKRIAFVDLTFNWPPVGGCWVDLKEIMTRLMGQGYDVTLVVPSWEDYYPRGRITEPLPFPIIKIPFSRFSFNMVNVRRRIRSVLRDLDPALVFLGDGYFMKGALLPALDEWPVILRIYSYELTCINLHYYLYRENRVCDGNFLTDPSRCHRCWYEKSLSPVKHLAGIVAGVEDRHPKLHFSQEYLFSFAFTGRYRRKIHDWLSIPKAIIVYNSFAKSFFDPYNSNVEVIPSGTDSNLFHPGPERPENGSPFRLLMTGRVNDPLKGYPVVVEACKILHDHGRDVELLITAAMDMECPEPFVKNLGWFPPDKLPALYHQADVCLVPSTWVEPFGITAVEAMASGVPVIASRTGGLRTSVVDEETGFLIDPGSPEELAKAVGWMMDYPQMRRRMAIAGRERVLEHFDWDVIVKKRYLPLLENILEG